MRKCVEAKTGIKFIIGLQAKNKPPYPFYCYNYSNFSTVQKTIKDIQKDGIFFRMEEENQEIIINIQAISMDVFEAANLADKLKKWLTGEGYYELIKQNIVIVRCEQTTQQDFFSVNDYERRWGFDCTLRIENSSTYPLSIIEKIKIKRS